MSDTPITLCRYWVKPEREEEFKVLLTRHWPTFQAKGLVTDAIPHLVLRGEHPEQGLFYVETFPWRDRAAMEAAHQDPDVGGIWGAMSDCCTSMEFPDVTPFTDASG